MKPTLNQVLADILADKPMEKPLSGGLMFQFKRPDGGKPAFRLFVYRRGDTAPSTTEFATVRRELERLLPGRVIALDRYNRTYTASDSVPRTGRVFSWQVQSSQAAFDLPPEKARYE